MLDKTGRQIKPHQLVDIYIQDVLSAFVIEVHEETLVAVHGDRPKAQLLLNIAIPITLNVGQTAPVYIVRQAPEEADNVPDEGPRRIM